jgi:DNA-directed RNA polymerase subunit RPC12/RpoP
MARNREYICQICGETFDNEVELRDHTQSQHSDYECEVCGQLFASQEDLGAHMAETHPDHEEMPNP